MKDKRILKDFETSKMSLNIYTSPLLALFFVYVSEFISSLFFGLSFLALIGLFSNLGVGGQRIADFLQMLFQNLSDKSSDIHLIFELLSFGFVLNTVFRWTRKVEKRPIRTLGFYKENFFSNLLKGFV